MKLYFVHDNSNDEEWDLLVWARRSDEAVERWRAYYWSESGDDDAPSFPDTIFEVPLNKPRKPHCAGPARASRSASTRCPPDQGWRQGTGGGS